MISPNKVSDCNQKQITMCKASKRETIYNDRGRNKKEEGKGKNATRKSRERKNETQTQTRTQTQVCLERQKKGEICIILHKDA